MSVTKKIWVLMGLNDKEFQTRMNAVTARLRRLQSESVRDARRLSITTQEMFYGMTLPMGLFAKTVVDATKRIEMLHIGLSTIAKSKGIDNIDKLVKDTTALAKLPGLGLEETFRGVKDLISVGFSSKGALDAVKGLGIGIARAGGNAETFGRIMTQVTQALAKGKLEMQDFKTIFEQMPEARGILENAFGPGMSDLEKLRKNGIGVRQVLGALVDGFTELGADNMMNTISNKIENLSDSWLIFRYTLGDNLFKEQIHNILDGLANGLNVATDAINNMSPQMKNLITETVKWFAAIAVGLPAITFLSKMFLLLRAQALGIAAAFLRMNPYVLAVASSLLLIEQIGKRLIPNWRGLTGELKLMGQQIIALATRYFPGLTNAFADLLGLKGKTNGRSGGGGLGFLKDWKKPIDETAISIDNITEKTWKLDEAIKGLSETFKKRMDIRAGFQSADPIPGMSSKDMASILFAQDRNNQFTSPQIAGGLEAGIMKSNLREITEGVRLGQQDWAAYFDTLEKGQESMARVRDIMNEMFTGPIADGVQGIADSFGTFMDSVLNGSEDAFGAMAKAMGNAVKDMIVSLVALIAKLAIAAALVAIIFPGAGGLKAFLGGSGGFAEGGAFFGKGGFLKGILGFADGGVVGGSSKYGDKILARVNSGELMLNESQQKSVYSQMSGGGRVSIAGELLVRGRNLVYVLEETQVQLKSAR